MDQNHLSSFFVSFYLSLTKVDISLKLTLFLLVVNFFYLCHSFDGRNKKGIENKDKVIWFYI